MATQPIGAPNTTTTPPSQITKTTSLFNGHTIAKGLTYSLPLAFPSSANAEESTLTAGHRYDAIRSPETALAICISLFVAGSFMLYLYIKDNRNGDLDDIEKNMK